MFFGLTNSPATFQTMMNELLRDLINTGKVLVYIDDILIFTNNLDEHRKLVRQVLSILSANKLYLKPEKCKFEKLQIEFLGLIVSEGKVEMDPIKVSGIRKWPVPNNKKELQQFLGFCNFYRRFVKDYSKITKINRKWHLKMGNGTANSFRHTEGNHYDRTLPSHTGRWRTIQSRSRHIGRSSRCGNLTTDRRQMAPGRFSLQSAFTHRTKLWNLRQGDAHNYGSVSWVETPLTRSQTNLQNLDRSSKPTILPTTSKT